MRTLIAGVVGGIVAAIAIRGFERFWDAHPSAALAAARLLQRAELDLQCMTEQMHEQLVALTPVREGAPALVHGADDRAATQRAAATRAVTNITQEESDETEDAPSMMQMDVARRQIASATTKETPQVSNGPATRTAIAAPAAPEDRPSGAREALRRPERRLGGR